MNLGPVSINGCRNSAEALSIFSKEERGTRDNAEYEVGMMKVTTEEQMWQRNA